MQLELERAYAKIKRMAQYDELTGLGNYYLFEDRINNLLTVAERSKRPFTLLLLDLDHFKEINDRLGHLIGDQVLARAGDRLRRISRFSNTVFRTGGDEFIILMETGVSHAGALHLARKIVRAIRKPIRLESGEFSIGVSIGIAFYPEHGSSIKQIIHHADSAMYADKRSGGGVSEVELEDAQ
jgi:diguanylate cyclase (GGDEF)-like protein